MDRGSRGWVPGLGVWRSALHLQTLRKAPTTLTWIPISTTTFNRPRVAASNPPWPSSVFHMKWNASRGTHGHDPSRGRAASTASDENSRQARVPQPHLANTPDPLSAMKLNLIAADAEKLPSNASTISGPSTRLRPLPRPVLSHHPTCLI
jgi:hypothetical protein